MPRITLTLAALALLAGCSSSPTHSAAKAPHAPAATCGATGSTQQDTTCRSGPYAGGGG